MAIAIDWIFGLIIATSIARALSEISPTVRVGCKIATEIVLKERSVGDKVFKLNHNKYNKYMILIENGNVYLVGAFVGEMVWEDGLVIYI